MSAAAPLALFAPRWLKGCSMDTSTESGCKGIHLPPASILGPCTLCLFLREVDSFLDPQPSFPCSCLSVIPGSGVWVWPWHPSSVSVLSHPSVTHHSGVPKSQASSWPAYGVHLSRMYPMAELQLTAQVSELVSQVHPSKPCRYSTPPLTTLWGGLQPQRALPGGAGRTHQRLTLQPAPGCSS